MDIYEMDWWGATIAAAILLCLLGLAAGLDYADARREECAKQNLDYNSSLDICEKDKPHGKANSR